MALAIGVDLVELLEARNFDYKEIMFWGKLAHLVAKGPRSSRYRELKKILRKSI